MSSGTGSQVPQHVGGEADGKRLRPTDEAAGQAGWLQDSFRALAEAADDARSPPDHPNDERADISADDLENIYEYSKLFVQSYEHFAKRRRRG